MMSVGLNLTAACKVICLDLSWNTATGECKHRVGQSSHSSLFSENQAVDRAHRIGQTKPVEVRRLVIKDTIEQRILDLYVPSHQSKSWS